VSRRARWHGPAGLGATLAAICTVNVAAWVTNLAVCATFVTHAAPSGRFTLSLADQTTPRTPPTSELNAIPARAPVLRTIRSLGAHADAPRPKQGSGGVRLGRLRGCVPSSGHRGRGWARALHRAVRAGANSLAVRPVLWVMCTRQAGRTTHWPGSPFPSPARQRHADRERQSWAPSGLGPSYYGLFEVSGPTLLPEAGALTLCAWPRPLHP
jgi:hypothetical protein